MPIATLEDKLLKWRKEFPILSETTYLVTHSMGAMPKKAAVYLNRYLEEWNKEAVTAWDKWLPYVLEHGNLIGSLIDAPEETIIMHQNVSTLTAIAISSIFQPGKRSKVVTTDLNFPSVYYNWKMHESIGMKIHMIRSPDGITIPLEAWEEAIDEETLAVVIDHGIFRSGFMQDVRAITKMAHAKGAYSFVDAYQTTGCVPFSVLDWDADFATGGSHKWLCGGAGAAWMYVKEDLIPKVEPRVTGWLSQANPFNFDLNMEFSSNAMRFATGTLGIPALYAARAGTEIIAEIGVDAIRQKSLQLTEKLINLAVSNGFQVNTPRDPDQRAGMVCIDFPGADQVEQELIKRKIIVDYRPKCGIRISPHFYTTEEEIDLFYDELMKLRNS